MEHRSLISARAPAPGTQTTEIEGRSLIPGAAATVTFEELNRKTTHLEFLYDVASRLLNTAEIDGFLDLVCTELTKLLDLAAYFHFRTDPKDPYVLRLANYGGISSETAAELREVRSENVLCGWVAVQRMPEVIDSVQQSTDPRLQFVRGLGITAYACFPLATANETYGTVSFARRGPDSFAQDEISLMRSLADHIASAIERTEAERRVRNNELQFRLVTESLPQLVWTSDVEGCIDYVNSQWTAYTGLGHENLLGPDWRERMHPEDRANTCDYWLKALKGEVPYDLDYRLRRADGEYRWFKARATPLRNTEGRITKWFGTCTDIHDNKVLEQKLRESEAWLRLLVGTVKDFALFSTDLNGNITEWNPGAENTFGYSEAEIIGKHVSMLFTPEDRAADVDENERQSAAREGSATDERWHMKKNGQRFFASGVARPIRDDTGHLHGFLKVCRDITQWKQHEQRLEETVAERTSRLRDMVGELESFSYSIVHDMRAPLRAMQSFARILEDECGPQVSPDGKDYIRRIVTAADRLDHLIQDVLSYSQASRADLPLTRIDSGKLLGNILESYPNLQWPAVEVELTGEFPLVLANEAALTQCISNLLTNAAKFVAPGVRPHIRVWAEPRDDRVRLLFQDNGIGIENASHEKIFGIFQRANRNYEGTGIGLAIVKKAIERMNGTVGLESKPGCGSTFWLELPRAN
jgi:PAS domain S-box-containing protein